jgi:hypothetical protein
VEDWQGAAILLREEGGTAAGENRCAGRLRSGTRGQRAGASFTAQTRTQWSDPPERHHAIGTTATVDGSHRSNAFGHFDRGKERTDECNSSSVAPNAMSGNQVEGSAAKNAR